MIKKVFASVLVASVVLCCLYFNKPAKAIPPMSMCQYDPVKFVVLDSGSRATITASAYCNIGTIYYSPCSAQAYGYGWIWDNVQGKYVPFGSQPWFNRFMDADCMSLGQTTFSVDYLSSYPGNSYGCISLEIWYRGYLFGIDYCYFYKP